MLVSVWDAMDGAIAQVAAEEWMAQYTIAVVSSPYVEKDSREKILDVWRNLIAGEWKQTVRAAVGSGSDYRVPLREVIESVKKAFGREIRD